MHNVVSRSLFALLLCSATVACSASPDDASSSDDEGASTEDALRSGPSITPGSFKLYPDANHQESPSCDVFTSLDITKASGGAMAKLKNQVAGMCPLAVDADVRSFRLKNQNGSCGIKTYTASKRVTGGRRSIKISDYRAATCAISIAPIVVEETLVDGSTNTLYASSTPTPPPPATAERWLTVAPQQCQTNPWDRTPVGQSHLTGELGRVASFFASKSIAIEQVGVLTPPSPMIVCAACSCPRGDLLVVKAANATDATRLQNEFGFSPAGDHAVGKGATSCSTNAWDPNHQDGTAADLNDWIAQQGVTASYAGFAEPTEPTITCMACGCPRGDRAVALTKTASGENKLVSLGWTELK